MQPHSHEEMQAALATTERLLASLRRERDLDQALRRIIQAVEDQQDELQASLLDTQARKPAGTDA